MKKVTAWIAFFSLFFFVSCDKSSFTEDFQLTKSTTGGGNNGGFGINPDPDATRGDTVTTSVYIQEKLVRAFLLGLTQNEISYVVGKHVPVSTIYSYSNLHMPAQFLPLTDDIATNPIWREIDIVFNPGFTAHQFTSVDELNAALHATNPEISLVNTDFYYRYTIIGK